MNKLYYISSELFHLPSYPFLANFYKKLLELDCFKILQSKHDDHTLSLKAQLNLTPHKIVQSTDADQNKYSLICSHSSIINEESDNHQDVLVIMHPLDITDLSKCINNCIQLKASAILSEILPDEITDSIDEHLTSFYSQHFSYLSAYQTEKPYSDEEQNSNEKNLIIYDNKAKAKSFLILARQPKIDAIGFEQLKFENSNNLILKMRNYEYVHLFFDNPIKESFIACILNAGTTPFFSNNSKLSPLRFLWNVSQQDQFSSLFYKNDSLRSKLQTVISESKNKTEKIIEYENLPFYSVEFQSIAFIKDIDCSKPKIRESKITHASEIYSNKLSHRFLLSKIRISEDKRECKPQWVMNPEMGKSFLSLINYHLENQDENRVKVLVEKLMEFWSKDPTSLSRIAMQPINEIYKNLFSKRQQYESITPAVEKLITHDIKKGIAVPNATIVLYALLSKNGEAEKAKQIFEWVINDKRWLLRALPDILIYTIIDNDLPKVDIGKITESMEDKIFHQFPERYLMLVIVYMLHGLYSRAEEAFKLIKTRFPKLFINKSKGETTLNRWFLLSICHKLNNDNKQATHFLELAFIIDREQEKVWNHLISKIEEQRHIPFTKIEIPNFATG